MGVVGLLQWLRECGYEAKNEYVSASSRLLVDAKCLMYTLAYALPSDCEDTFHHDLALLMLSKLKAFQSVVLVNDGKIHEDHPKFATCCKRREDTIKRQEAVKRQKTDQEEEERRTFFVQHLPICIDDEPVSVPDLSALEKQARNARGIGYEDTVKVLEYMMELQPTYEIIDKDTHEHKVEKRIRYIQVVDGEADQFLMSMASEFDYVVSNDGDGIPGGIKKLLYNFCKPNQVIYNAEEICAHLKLTLRQLQEICALSGNDYGKGIKNMGLKRAYPLILKYGNVKTMLEKWTPLERKQFQVPPDILQQVETSVEMYSP